MSSRIRWVTLLVEREVALVTAPLGFAVVEFRAQPAQPVLLGLEFVLKDAAPIAVTGALRIAVDSRKRCRGNRRAVVRRWCGIAPGG